jgi:hypothetical protein
MSREYSSAYGREPLTPAEQQQLTQSMSQLAASDQQAIRDGVQCLPAPQRDRAMLEWCQRWES